MGTRIIYSMFCDLDETHAILDDQTVFTHTIVVDSKAYEFDLDEQCEATWTMNTLGALIDIARAPGQSAPAARLAAAPVSTGTNQGPPKKAGRRRYHYDQYQSLWGVVVNGVSQLQCPLCDYETAMSGSTAALNNRKMGNLRGHLVHGHDGKIMWALAADSFGDPYDRSLATVA